MPTSPETWLRVVLDILFRQMLWGLRQMVWVTCLVVAFLAVLGWWRWRRSGLEAAQAVADLRARGIGAGLCPKCRGRGRLGRRKVCAECHGLGYWCRMSDSEAFQ